jgi:hypothetical protein
MERWGFSDDAYRYDFASTLAYSAARPFAYRVLMPALVNGTAAAIPHRAKVSLGDYFEKKSLVYQRFYRKDKGQNAANAWTKDYELKYHLAYYYELIFLFGAMLMLRALARACHPDAPALYDAAPVVYALFLLPAYLRGGHIYDFPEMFFLAACSHAAVTRKVQWLVLLLPLAVLNKESDILLLILLSPLLVTALQSRGALAAVMSSALLAVLVFVGTRVVFAGNPGGQVEFYLPENLRFWSKPGPYLDFTAVYAPGVPFPKLQSVFFSVPLLLLVARQWTLKPQWLRRMLVIATVVNVPLLLLFGAIDEIRNLSLIFVPIYLACCHSLRMLYGAGAAQNSVVPEPEMGLQGYAPDGPSTAMPELPPPEPPTVAVVAEQRTA